MAPNPLYEMLRSKYQIGDNFIAAYLDWVFNNEDLDLETFNRKLEDPVQAIWTNYALSCNQRGRDFAHVMRPYLPQNARRCLDIGSAYGGALIGFLDQGMEVRGIEISEALVRLSQANFRDFGLDDVTLLGDVLDKTLLVKLGKFDLITCIDVIEHVNDIDVAMENMIGQLNPGGILVIQVPNRDSISNVLSDPHYGQFGLTLLMHDEASQFFFCHGTKVSKYGVGEFWRQKEYIRKMTALGCTVEVLPPMTPTTIRGKAALVPGFYRRWLKFVLAGDPPLPVGLKFKVVIKAFLHVSSFVAALALAMLLPGLKGDIKQRYADDTWFLVATKTG